jgi:hypothetical protein
MPASVRTPSTSVANRRIPLSIVLEGHLLTEFRFAGLFVDTKRLTLTNLWKAYDTRQVGLCKQKHDRGSAAPHVRMQILTLRLCHHPTIHVGKSSGESRKGRGEKPRSRAASAWSNTKSRFMRSAISTVQFLYCGNSRNVATASRNSHRGIVIR